MKPMSTSNIKQLSLTDAAARKVKALIDEEGNQALKLRVYITGGGCSGFQYGFTFDETIKDDDNVVIKTVEDEEKGGEGSNTGQVYLLTDPLSYTYLMGAEIDYSEGIQGAQFIIRNPNAQTTCGCGQSFAV